MVADSINNLEQYCIGNKNFEIAIHYIKNTDLDSLPDGKTFIYGEDVSVTVSEYEPKKVDEKKFESHLLYADIQVVISGSELIGWQILDSLKASTEYDIKRDIIFYNGEGTYMNAKPGLFFIFYPQDGHKPSISDGNCKKVRKAVFKIKLE